MVGKGKAVRNYFSNPSPQPPPRDGEGERTLVFSPSPLRGGGRGEGFLNSLLNRTSNARPDQGEPLLALRAR